MVGPKGEVAGEWKLDHAFGNGEEYRDRAGLSTLSAGRAERSSTIRSNREIPQAGSLSPRSTSRTGTPSALWISTGSISLSASYRTPAKKSTLSGLRSSRWKYNAEGGAAAFRTLHRYRGVVHVRNPFGDGQPETGAVYLGSRRVGSKEALEYARKHRLRDADTGIANAEAGLGSGRLERKFDAAPGGRVYLMALSTSVPLACTAAGAGWATLR